MSLVIVVLLMYIVYTLYADRREAQNFYMDNLIAYKVGLIRKKAKENEVELIFMTPEDKFLKSVEDKVDRDIEQ